MTSYRLIIVHLRGHRLVISVPHFESPPINTVTPSMKLILLSFAFTVSGHASGDVALGPAKSPMFFNV